jgi:hypothetical protein
MLPPGPHVVTLSVSVTVFLTIGDERYCAVYTRNISVLKRKGTEFPIVLNNSVLKTEPRFLSEDKLN